MYTNRDSARKFFEACETGKGWDACSVFCHVGATFSSQTAALAGIETLEAYCEWMKGMYTPMPNGRYELLFFGEDEGRNSVAAIGVYHGTHTGEGGPVPATGKSVSAEYAYNMMFKGDRISHMTKVWNDTFSLQKLGWG